MRLTSNLLNKVDRTNRQLTRVNGRPTESQKSISAEAGFYIANAAPAASRSALLEFFGSTKVSSRIEHQHDLLPAFWCPTRLELQTGSGRAGELLKCYRTRQYMVVGDGTVWSKNLELIFNLKGPGTHGFVGYPWSPTKGEKRGYIPIKYEGRRREEGSRNGVVTRSSTIRKAMPKCTTTWMW